MRSQTLIGLHGRLIPSVVQPWQVTALKNVTLDMIPPGPDR